MIQAIATLVVYHRALTPPKLDNKYTLLVNFHSVGTRVGRRKTHIQGLREYNREGIALNAADLGLKALYHI